MCEATGFPVGNEDGVIAEAVLADGGGEDAAFGDPCEDVLPVIPDEGDDGAEAGAAVGCIAQALQELVDILLDRKSVV